MKVNEIYLQQNNPNAVRGIVANVAVGDVVAIPDGYSDLHVVGEVRAKKTTYSPHDAWNADDRVELRLDLGPAEDDAWAVITLPAETKVWRGLEPLPRPLLPDDDEEDEDDA